MDFSNSDVHFNTTNARGHNVIFASTSTGVGITSPHTNSWGDVNPLLPFTYGWATSNADWTLFDIPSGLPSNTTHLFLTGTAIVGAAAIPSKYAFYYLSAKIPSGTWYTPGAILTGFSVDTSDGERDTSGMIVVPVENGQYMLKWFQHTAQGYYQDASEADYGINLSLAGYATPKTGGSGGGLTEAEVQALIDASIPQDHLTAAEAQALIDAKIAGLTASTTISAS